MAGLNNTGIRDYCGTESSITKLSNHFSKDLTYRHDGINETQHESVNSNTVPTSFDFNKLLKSAETSNASPQSISQLDPPVESRPSDSVNSEKYKAQAPTNYCIPPIFSPMTFSVPVNRFVSAPTEVVAKQWAESELSKYDDVVICEDDLKKLSEERENSQMRKMANQEEMDVIDLTSEDDNLEYDLEKDLKNMREKIDSNDVQDNVWSQIEKSLQENSDYSSRNKNSSEILFNKNNSYLNELKSNENLSKDDFMKDVLLKGIKLYKEGYFSKATLAFEAVVQMDPQSEAGWSYLAMCLSENEQDHKAIIACKKCLELNKSNREVLLSMARIHCNEMNLSSTIASLEQWLLANPKYSDLATVGQDALYSTEANNLSMLDDAYEIAFESSGKFAIIDQQLQMALNRNQFDIDPELEIAAGTLFHAVQDYERAMMRFEAAVNVIKDNACLWNKLGTAYCNSGNYEKSINAYRKALELAPGFARAECNLGVAYYNMESYKNAIEHAIKAHKIQNLENLSNTENQRDETADSNPIWTLIRMSSFKLNRPDLDLCIFERDIESLSKEFGV